MLPLSAASLDDLTYVNDGNSVTITDCDEDASGELIIPYTIDGLVVTSIGNETFRDCTSLTSITIPDGVTSIGSYAFYGCTSLTSITIPDGVTSIGGRAFYNCTSLTSITIPDSVTSIVIKTFQGCTSLTSITMGNCVTSIGSYAFYGCTSLTSITIPDGVTSIGNYVFYQCTSLTSITIPDSVTYIGNYAFYGCTSLTSINFLPATAPSLGNNAFGNLPDSARYNTLAGATGYTTDSFGDVIFGATLVDSDEDGVVDVSDAFPNDPNEWADTDGDGVGDNTDDSDEDGVVDANDAFPNDPNEWADTDCDGVGDNSDAFPENATETVDTDGDGVGDNSDAFPNDAAETLDTDGDGVGNNADTDDDGDGFVDNSDAFPNFDDNLITYTSDDTSVTITDCDESASGTLVIPDTIDGLVVTSIGNETFRDCTRLTSVTIGDGVTSIGDRTFSDCTRLTSVTIPDGVTSIENYVFYGCTSLTSITIGDGVTSIYYRAFYGCTSLTSITIPDGVTSIGVDAFRDCTSLTSITIPNGVTSIGNYVFYQCTSLKSVNIPDSVTSIGIGAFRYCESLTSITIPDGVTSIANYAFDNCTSLTSINFLPATAPSLGNNVFGNLPDSARYNMLAGATGYTDPFGGVSNVDTDGDGVGDNSDAFPNDPNEWADTDGDGVGNNSDAFPNDPNKSDPEFGGFLMQSFSVGNYPRWVTAGDGDGSGNGIFVAADRDDDKLTTYVYTGEVWSQLEDRKNVGDKPVHIISADFDGDNDLDVVTFDRNDNKISSLLRDGSGNFSQRSTTGVGNKPQGGTIADLYGNGDLDLAVANYKGNSVSILFGDGAGGFSFSQTLSIGNRPMDVTAADIDNDSDMDLIMVDYKKVIYIIENNGGTFSEFDSILMSGNPGGPAAVGDFDDDGNIDFAVTDRSNDSVGVYLGNGNGTFSDPSDIDVGESPRDILAVDLDEDGVLDLAVANQDDNSLTTLLGDGTGDFPTSVTFSLEGGPVGLSSYDYDGDGDMDLFAALPDVDEVAVLENVTGDKDDDGNFYSYNSGVVADGYIEGARVFLDQNGNEEWDEGEPYAFTDDEGRYVLVSPESDASVVTEGGIDVSTGTAFDAKLVGPRGAKVLSPLTSMVESMVRSGDVSDYETANKLVSESLGVVGEVIDFMNFDAIERVNDTSRTAAERTQASEIAQAAVQLGSVMNVSTSLGIDSSDVVKNLGIKISSDPGQAAQFDLREKLSTSSEIEEIIDGSDDPQLKDRAEKLAATNDQIRRQSGTGGMAAEQGKLFSTVGIGARPGPAPRPGPFSVKKEQGQNVFNISLKRAPTDDVQIDISIDNPDSLVLNEDFLEFDATNWSQPQIVTISVEKDAEVVNFSPREIIFSISEDFTDDDKFLEMDSESFPFAIRPSGLQGDIRAERLLAENFGDPVSYNGKECKIYGSLETLGQYADTDDVIGVYVGDELRGKISTVAFSEIGSFEGAIAVKADGEVATFKVFDASMGEILEVPDYSVSLESGAEIGSSTDPVSLTAGYSLADVIYDPRGPRGSTTRPKITSVTYVEGELRFKLKTQNNFNYRIESSEDMINWTEELMVVGNGSKMPIRVNAEEVGRKFIRARAEVAQGNDQGGGGL